MSGTRVPFDPAGPFVVASSELVCGAGRLSRGAPFPTVGLTSHDLATLWVALKIDVAPAPPAAAPAVPAKHYDRRPRR